MAYEFDEEGHLRLDEFLSRIGSHLRRNEQRESFAMYALGILGDGERKSVEPIAARLAGDPVKTARTHDRILHFLREAPWDDSMVRLEAARYVTNAMREHDSECVWILDDTGFLKQGTHSVGVQRQYTGSAGKIANCQVAVSLCVANRKVQAPIDFELYLPRSWTDDNERRIKSRIPLNCEFKTKPEIAVDLLTRAIENGIQGQTVLADSAYGTNFWFRTRIRELGLDFAVALGRSTSVWLVDANGARIGSPLSAEGVAQSLGQGVFRHFCWREGTKGKLSSRFLFRRVCVAHEDGTLPDERERQWLIIEWPEQEAKPTGFFLTTLPRRMSKKRIIRTIKERWRTEMVYRELKQELGLDHFEGRSFSGWHHHVSVVLCCYAFIVTERLRHFSPRTLEGVRNHAFLRAA